MYFDHLYEVGRRQQTIERRVCRCVGQFGEGEKGRGRERGRERGGDGLFVCYLGNHVSLVSASFVVDMLPVCIELVVVELDHHWYWYWYCRCR